MADSGPDITKVIENSVDNEISTANRFANVLSYTDCIASVVNSNLQRILDTATLVIRDGLPQITLEDLETNPRSGVVQIPKPQDKP